MRNSRHVQRALFSALLLASIGSAAACDLAGEQFDPQDGKADDFGSCADSLDCGTREIEVLFTSPFCDECQPAEKAVLLARSPIIERVVSLIDGASSNIDIAQFTFSRKEIEEALLAAHARGVNIRIAMDAGQDNAGTVATRLRDAGLAVRLQRSKRLLHARWLGPDHDPRQHSRGAHQHRRLDASLHLLRSRHRACQGARARRGGSPGRQ